MKKLFHIAAAMALTACAMSPEYAAERQAHFDSKRPHLMEAKAASAPIYVYAFSPKAPNSAGGVPVVGSVRNLTDKPIKYVHFNAMPFNAVGDEQASQIGNIKLARVTVTGPLTPDQFVGPKWDNVWYNPSISCTVVRSVQVVFMDGSIVSIGLEGDATLLETVLAPEITRDCAPKM